MGSRADRVVSAGMALVGVILVGLGAATWPGPFWLGVAAVVLGVVMVGVAVWA